MQKTVKLTSKQAQMSSECDCEAPVLVTTRSGRRIVVPCGHCPICRRKRSNQWIKRLVDEQTDPRCFHCFGFTLTYDNYHLPWLYKSELDTISQLDKNNQSDILDEFYDGDTIKIHRGISNNDEFWESKKTDPIIGVLYKRDIQLFLKKLRKWLDKTYPQFIIRYYIHGEYGTTTGNTHRPHYHGIAYICSKSQDPYDCDFSERQTIVADIEQHLLDCWEHCEQKFDGKQYVCKSIQQFGGKWGNYCANYTSKNDISKLEECYGCLYIPEFCMCSRENPLYGYGSIGSFFLTKHENEHLFGYNRSLYYSEKTGAQWKPTYEENGYNKPLPLAYKRIILQRYFNFKFSDFAKYILVSNLAPADLQQLVYKSLERRRFSIYKRPLSGWKTVDYVPTPEMVQNFERFIRWSETQVECYLNLFSDNDDDHFFLLTRDGLLEHVDPSDDYHNDYIVARFDKVRKAENYRIYALEKHNQHVQKYYKN